MQPERDLNQYLKQIYEAEGPKLYGYLVKKAGAELAQDIMQEAFTRLFDRLKKMADISNARAYLFQIARHLFYHEAAFARRFTGSDAHLENTAAPAANEKDGLEQSELMRILGGAVSTLSVKEREIFEMRWNAGLTQVEIAGVLKKSERQIRRDLEKIVSKLRAHFKTQGWGDAEGLTV